MKTFADLGLPEILVETLTAAGFTEPTKIQNDAIPHLLKGRDVLGIAQTGSGKTAAFGLPILVGLMAQQVRPRPMSARALILAPTRELAVQIEEAMRSYAGGRRLSTVLVLGGMSRYAQIQKIAKGVDVMIATPGRLMDLIDDGKVWLNETKYLVLDEADRMLDMGFIGPVKAIAKQIGHKRQTMLFSATMADNVAELAAGLLHNPLRVEAAPQGSTVVKIDQRAILSGSKAKRGVLNELLADASLEKVIIFARTKHGADRVVKNLIHDGHAAAAIHGNKSQNARQAALKDFASGQVRLLVATDIAARGIDVPGITHVINYELPDDAENYVHRIGRTGRNGASGHAITLCDGTEQAKLRQIERLIRRTLPVSGDLKAANMFGVKAGASVAERPERPHADRSRPTRPQHADRPARREDAARKSVAAQPQRRVESDARPHAAKPAKQHVKPASKVAQPGGPKTRWTREQKLAAKARKGRQGKGGPRQSVA